MFGPAHQPPAAARGAPRPGRRARGAPPPLVSFDALGTLVELEPPAPRLRRVLAACTGVELTSEQAERAIAAEISYYRAHLDEGRDQPSLARLRRRCAEVLRAELPPPGQELGLDTVEAALLESLSFGVYHDARAALIAARKLPARVLVVSNWDVSLERVLQQLGLTPLLDGVLTSAGTGARKPSPEIFARALAQADVPPQHAVHVGDSLEEDIAGASAAGVRPILLRRDGRPAPPGVTTIATLAELQALL